MGIRSGVGGTVHSSSPDTGGADIGGVGTGTVGSRSGAGGDPSADPSARLSGPPGAAPSEPPSGPPGETAELVRRLAGGEDAAARLLLSRFTPALGAIVRGYPLCEADRTEAVQETWSLLWAHLPTLRDPERLGGWLRTTAHRQARTLVRRRHREPAVLEVLPQQAGPGGPAEPEPAMLHAERAGALGRALRQLDERDRTLATALADEPGAGYAELARRIGVPEGSIGPLRSRCLRRLRRLLTEDGIAGAVS